MADERALAVETIDSSSASYDGLYIILRLALAGAVKLTLAVPHKKVLDLMCLVSSAAGGAARARNADPRLKHVLPVEWWEIGQHPDNQMIVLSYRLPGGMELSFQVQPEAANAIMETLALQLNKSAANLASERTLN